MTAKDKSIIRQFGQTTLKGIFLSSVLHAGGDWSGDLLVADYEDVQESKDSKKQEIFVKKPYEFLCANGTLELPGCLRPSPTVEVDFVLVGMMKSQKVTSQGIRGPRVENLTP